MKSVLHAKFLDLTRGSHVIYEGREYALGELIDGMTILAEDVETNEWSHLSVSKLEFLAADKPLPAPDVVVHKEGYAKAQKRLLAVEDFRNCPLRSEEEVKRIAKSHGISKSTLYSWVQRYLDAPQLASLIPTKPGPDRGLHKLDPKVEVIVQRALELTVRTPQRERAAKAASMVKNMCKTAGMKPPHDNTVRARINALPRARTLREQRRYDQAEQLDPVLGRLEAARPMEVVEMDHALADTELVDDKMRQSLGRPWITLLIDVCTRVVIGVALSMQRPSAFLAGSAVANAMLPKHDYLRRLDIKGEWNAWGQIGTLQMDNAKEFRGTVIKTSCESYGINPYFRPVKTPRYGAHIERLMGTVAGELRSLPGATFANPSDRKGYDSEREAAITFSEFEKRLVYWIVNVYNKRPHSSLWGMTPEAYWNEKIAEKDEELSGIVQRPPKDPDRVRIDFMPFENRVIGRKGILLDHVHYWDDIFKTRIDEPDPLNRKEKRKFLVRYDPRNINAIWFYDPDRDRYSRIATLYRARPAVSLWEWRAVKTHLQAKGLESYDEDRMFEALNELRRMDEESVKKTKAVRRQMQLRAQAEAVGKDYDKNEAARIPTPPSPASALPANSTKQRNFKPIDGVEF